MAILLSACREPSVHLTYRFAPDKTTTYRWTIQAQVQTDSPFEQSGQNVRLVLEASEAAQSPKPEGATPLRLQIRVVSRVENGVAVQPSAEPLVVELEVKPSGALQSASSASVGGFELDTLLSEAYPLLPAGRVDIGHSWDASLVRKTPATSVDLEGTGRLLGFELRDRRRLARVEIRRSGRVTSTQTVDRANISITGRATITTTAHIDIDRGLRFMAKSRSVSQFDLTTGPGASVGKRRIEIHTEVELI